MRCLYNVNPLAVLQCRTETQSQERAPSGPSPRQLFLVIRLSNGTTLSFQAHGPPGGSYTSPRSRDLGAAINMEAGSCSNDMEAVCARDSIGIRCPRSAGTWKLSDRHGSTLRQRYYGDLISLTSASNGAWLLFSAYYDRSS
jgi:hypothetical protein